MNPEEANQNRKAMICFQSNLCYNNATVRNGYKTLPSSNKHPASINTASNDRSRVLIQVLMDTGFRSPWGVASVIGRDVGRYDLNFLNRVFIRTIRCYSSVLFEYVYWGFICWCGNIFMCVLHCFVHSELCLRGFFSQHACLDPWRVLRYYHPRFKVLPSVGCLWWSPD